MRNQANAKRSDVEFAVGDLVYVKLHPYRQSTVAHRKNMKLARRYFGPFLITARIGVVAYKLRLLENVHIHDVFHVSLLKKHFGPAPAIEAALPLDFMGARPLITHVAVLDRRTIIVHGQYVPQILVQ